MNENRTIDLIRLRDQWVRLEFWRFLLAVIALIVIGALALALVGYTVFAQQGKMSWEVLSLLLLVMLCFSLPLFQKFQFGKDSTSVEMARPMELIEKLIVDKSNSAEDARIEVFNQLQQRIGDLSAQLSAISEKIDKSYPQGILPAAGKPEADAGPNTEPTIDELRRQLPASEHEEDPQKGRFGGAEEVGGRRLSAKIEPSAIGKQWRKVILSVQTLNREPISGRFVYFFVHDSFQPDFYRAAPDKTGTIATVTVQAYGAFTVGAVLDRGKTLLELDLATSPNVVADKAWRGR